MKKLAEKKLKIVFISEFFPATSNLDLHGGVEMRTFLISREFARSHQVTVICSKEKDKPIIQILEHINIHRVGPITRYTQEGRILDRLIFILASFFQALKLDFDLVEGSGILGLIPAFFAAKVKNKKAVAFVPDLFNTTLVGIAEKLIINNYWDKIITISEVVKKKLERIGVKSEKITVIFPPVISNPNIKVSKTKYPSLSVVARLVKYKGLDDIIEATAQVVKQYPQILVNIVGEGSEKAKLLTKIQELNLENNIKLLGFIKNHNDVLKIIKYSWIYLSASRFEGFGISLAEAMNLKIPFVVADTPVYHEITKNSGGFFYLPGHPQILAEKILTILNNYTKKSTDLTKNNSIVTNLYSLSTITTQTVKCFLLFSKHSQKGRILW